MVGVEEILIKIIKKLRHIATSSKDSAKLRNMLIEYAFELEAKSTESNEEPITINDDDEAEFIQNYLLIQGAGIISTSDIKLVIDGQLEYMLSLGLVETDEYWTYNSGPNSAVYKDDIVVYPCYNRFLIIPEQTVNIQSSLK